MTREGLIAARGVGRRFGARTALVGVDLELAPGETLALVGPNGAGKTTLLAILAGALEPTEGTVERHAAAGFVPQRAAVYRRLTARENLRLFARLERLPDADAAADAMLGRAGLEEFADVQAGSLSVGQRQRVNVAIGLLGDPAAVLLDEPTAALDPRQRALLWALLADVVARGGAVAFTTQNVEEVDRHASRMLLLVDGAPAFAGSVAGFREEVGQAPDEGFEEAFVRFLARRGDARA